MSGLADKDFNAQAYYEGVITSPTDVDGYQWIIHRRSCGVRQNTRVSNQIDGATALGLFDLVASAESSGQHKFCEVCCVVQYGSPLGVGYMKGRPRRAVAQLTEDRVCSSCYMTSCDCAL